MDFSPFSCSTSSAPLFLAFTSSELHWPHSFLVWIPSPLSCLPLSFALFLINYSLSFLYFHHPFFTGILETDITFLVIFSLVFVLSCYFACKYHLFHLTLSLFLLLLLWVHLFWLPEPQQSFNALFFRSIITSTCFLEGMEVSSHVSSDT